MKRFDTLAAWLAWQETLHPRAIDLGLERVARVAKTLGVGRFAAPVITVGGTNGKGSCVALLEAMLRAQGYRVGAFTSPHLVRYQERIRVDAREIGEPELLAAFERIDEARGDTTLTFFEFSTLTALLAFVGAELDAVVLEVGLGGRLDAVNVVDCDVALLTSIGLDHCDWLGPTLEDIGREKAGIFRRGRPAVVATLPVPASVAESAKRIGALLRLPGVDFTVQRTDAGWAWSNGRVRYDDLPLPALMGRRQLDNAAAVLAVLDELHARLPLSRTAIVNGLEKIELAGRFQRFPREPEWILDVAHNPDAAAHLAQTLASVPARGRTLAIAGILKDKDARAVIDALAPHIDQWIAVDLPAPRGLRGPELRALAGATSDPRWSVAPTVASACERARSAALPGDRVLVFGSFHTVGPALEWLARSA